MMTYHDQIVLQFDTFATGNAGSGKLVTVYEAGTKSKAAIFSPKGSPISNPLTTDNKGNYAFQAIDGVYDLFIDEGLPSEYLLTNVEIAESSSKSGFAFDPKDFGATSTVDSSVEVQATYDTASSLGGFVYLSESYRCDTSIAGGTASTFGPGNLDFRKATTLPLNSTCLYYEGSLTNLGETSAVTEKGKATITLATPPTDLTPGDVVLIGSTEQYTDAREAYKKGEGPIVSAVDGTKVDVFGSLFDTYPIETTTIFKLNPVSVTFDSNILASPLRGARGLWIKNGQNCKITGLVVGAGTNGLIMQQCLDSQVSGAYSIEVEGEPGSYTGTEYGLVIANCQRISTTDSTLIGERHGVSTGGFLNDYANDTVAIVCREGTVTGNKMSQDLIAADHDLGSSIAGFDLHGNTEFFTVDNNVIMNGAVYAGNNNTFTNNQVYGSNDNGGQLFRCVEMVGAQHKISGNTFTSTVGRASVSKDVPFFFALFTTTNTPGISSNNALRFGGTLEVSNNTFVNEDLSTVANTKPHELQWRIDETFTEDIDFVFENNTTKMPKNGNLYSIGFRTLALSSFVTNPRNLRSLTFNGNKWYNCGSVNTLSEDDTTQFAVDRILVSGDEIFSGEQAQYSHFIRNAKDFVSIKDCDVDGVSASPIYITNGAMASKIEANSVNNAQVKGNTFTNCTSSGVGSTTRNMGLMIGVKDLQISGNTNISHATSNSQDLFYLAPWSGFESNVYLNDNSDTSGIQSYNYGPDYLANTNHQQVKGPSDLKGVTNTAAFLMKYNQKDAQKVNTVNGGFNISFSATGLTQNATFSIMDVGGALDLNPVSLTMNGYTFEGVNTLVLNIVRKTYDFQLDGTNWVVTNG